MAAGGEWYERARGRGETPFRGRTPRQNATSHGGGAHGQGCARRAARCGRRDLAATSAGWWGYDQWHVGYTRLSRARLAWLVKTLSRGGV